MPPESILSTKFDPKNPADIEMQNKIIKAVRLFEECSILNSIDPSIEMNAMLSVIVTNLHFIGFSYTELEKFFREIPKGFKHRFS